MPDRFAPILPSRSFDATAAFYERAGFEVVRRTEPPDYAWMILARVHLQLHFYAFEHDPATSDRMVYLHLDDPDEWADHLRKLDLPADGIASFRDIEDRDWEMREFALVDPDGTLIRAGRSSQGECQCHNLLDAPAKLERAASYASNILLAGPSRRRQ